MAMKRITDNGHEKRSFRNDKVWKMGTWNIIGQDRKEDMIKECEKEVKKHCFSKEFTERLKSKTKPIL